MFREYFNETVGIWLIPTVPFFISGLLPWLTENVPRHGIGAPEEAGEGHEGGGTEQALPLTPLNKGYTALATVLTIAGYFALSYPGAMAYPFVTAYDMVAQHLGATASLDRRALATGRASLSRDSDDESATGLTQRDFNEAITEMERRVELLETAQEMFTGGEFGRHISDNLLDQFAHLREDVTRLRGFANELEASHQGAWDTLTSRPNYGHLWDAATTGKTYSRLITTGLNALVPPEHDRGQKALYLLLNLAVHATATAAAAKTEPGVTFADYLAEALFVAFRSTDELYDPNVDGRAALNTFINFTAHEFFALIPAIMSLFYPQLWATWLPAEGRSAAYSASFWLPFLVAMNATYGASLSHGLVHAMLGIPSALHWIGHLMGGLEGPRALQRRPGDATIAELPMVARRASEWGAGPSTAPRAGADSLPSSRGSDTILQPPTLQPPTLQPPTAHVRTTPPSAAGPSPVPIAALPALPSDDTPDTEETPGTSEDKPTSEERPAAAEKPTSESDATPQSRSPRSESPASVSESVLASWTSDAPDPSRQDSDLGGFDHVTAVSHSESVSDYGQEPDGSTSGTPTGEGRGGERFGFLDRERIDLGSWRLRDPLGSPAISSAALSLGDSDELTPKASDDVVSTPVRGPGEESSVDGRGPDDGVQSEARASRSAADDLDGFAWWPGTAVAGPVFDGVPSDVSGEDHGSDGLPQGFNDEAAPTTGDAQNMHDAPTSARVRFAEPSSPSPSEGPVPGVPGSGRASAAAADADADDHGAGEVAGGGPNSFLDMGPEPESILDLDPEPDPGTRDEGRFGPRSAAQVGVPRDRAVQEEWSDPEPGPEHDRLGDDVPEGTDLDHEYGPLVPPKRVKDEEADSDGLPRVNPALYRFSEMPPEVLLSRTEAVWHYTVGADGEIRIGSEELGRMLSDDELLDSFADYHHGERPEIDDPAVQEFRNRIDGQGHPTIAVEFTDLGRVANAAPPSRVSGEIGWNGEAQRWEVNDKSGRYMSEKVRVPMPDTQDLLRWIGNVADRLSRRLGVSVTPVLLKHADRANQPVAQGDPIRPEAGDTGLSTAMAEATPTSAIVSNDGATTSEAKSGFGGKRSSGGEPGIHDVESVPQQSSTQSPPTGRAPATQPPPVIEQVRSALPLYTAEGTSAATVTATPTDARGLDSDETSSANTAPGGLTRGSEGVASQKDSADRPVASTSGFAVLARSGQSVRLPVVASSEGFASDPSDSDEVSSVGAVEDFGGDRADSDEVSSVGAVEDFGGDRADSDEVSSVGAVEDFGGDRGDSDEVSSVGAVEDFGGDRGDSDEVSSVGAVEDFGGDRGDSDEVSSVGAVEDFGGDRGDSDEVSSVGAVEDFGGDRGDSDEVSSVGAVEDFGGDPSDSDEASSVGAVEERGGRLYLPFDEGAQALTEGQIRQEAVADFASHVANEAELRYRAGLGGVVLHAEGGGNGGRFSDGRRRRW